MQSKDQDELAKSENYQEISSVLKKAYKTCQIPLHIEIDRISQWVKSDNLLPLLITSEKQGGKKSLLCSFIRQCEAQEESKIFLITQFASIAPYFSEILYRIMMQIRNFLNIEQKVELNQEKLRQYFRYWLEVADQKLQKQYLSYEKQNKKKIVIIIEGIDKVVDTKGVFISPSFWLPQATFKNIKLIFTSSTKSPVIQILKDNVSEIIQHVLPHQKIRKFRTSLQIEDNRIMNMDQQIHIQDLKIISKVLKKFPIIKLQVKQTAFMFFKEYIKAVSEENICEQTIISILMLLMSSKKGLSRDTIRRSLKLKTTSINYFLESFKDIVLQTNLGYIIVSERIKGYTQKLIKQKDHQKQFKIVQKSIHLQIANALKKEVPNINTLQQMIYHLVACEDFTELKQLLSRIENFLVLYTPLTKHILCMCWLQLELKFQYDPVFQYNKAIERFLSHYYPSTQDTFKIIFQLSLFFKEYSEFQNHKTPHFRHPPIRGEVEHLKEITIYDQLIKMGMYQKCKQKNKELTLHRSLEEESPKDKDDTSCSINLRQSAQNEIKQAEKLNIKIKFHQDKFKNQYLEQMELYINQFYLPRRKQLMNNKDRLLDEDSDDSQTELEQNKIDIDKIKKGLILKKFSDYSQEIYHRFTNKRSFYYYKQWVWMQFPWISQSLYHHYSRSIENCMKSPTQYMSIEQQSKLIMNAVKIAKIARKNKEQIFESKTDLLSQRYSKDKSSQYSVKKSNCSKNKISKIKQSQVHINSMNINKSMILSINFSDIDEQLKKYPKQSRTKKSEPKSKYVPNSFLTDLSMCNSYLEDKENNQSKTNRFPAILNSKVTARKDQNILQSRAYGLLILKYDEIKNENKGLLGKIEQLKISQERLQGNSKQQQKLKIQKQIQEAKNRNSKIQHKYSMQQSFKSRLQMIIKLSDVNKSHGSQSADLSNFQNSLKFMIKLEEKKLQDVNKNAKKFLDERKAEYKKLKEERIKLSNKLKKQNKKLSESRVTNKSVKKLQQSVQLKNKKERNRLKQQQAIKVKLEKDLDVITEEEIYLSALIGIDLSAIQQTNTQPLIETRLLQYQSQINKRKQLQWKLNQLVQQNQNKGQEMTQLQNKLNITEGYWQHNKKTQLRNQKIEKQEKYQSMQSKKKYLEHCLRIACANSQPNKSVLHSVS